MDWFLYDNGPRLKRVNVGVAFHLNIKIITLLAKKKEMVVFQFSYVKISFRPDFSGAYTNLDSSIQKYIRHAIITTFSLFPYLLRFYEINHKMLH